MLKNLRILAIVFCVCAFMVSESRAQNVYEFLFSQPTYTAATAGEAVSATVRLRETSPAGTTAQLAPGGNDGLFTFGLTLDFGTATGGAGATIAPPTVIPIVPPITIAPVRESVDFGESSIIEILSTEINIDSAQDADATSLGADGTLVSVDGSGASIYELDLFTVDFLAGDVGSVTTLQLSDLVAFDEPANQGLNINRNQFADRLAIDDIDTSATFSSSQIVVGATVPEPGSLLALGALMMGGVLRRRRS